MWLFQREFRRNIKGLLIWTIIIGGLVIFTLSVYPQFAEQQEGFEDFMQAFPEGFMKAFGMDRVSIITPLGFYAIECYLMTTLFGSIYAVSLGSSIVSKEENEKTAEFLLSKPITRFNIISQKLLLVLANLIIFNIISVLISYFGLAMGDAEYEVNIFILLSFVGPFLLHLTFATLTFLISIIIRRSRTIFSISLGIVFVTYFFNVMAQLSDKFEFLKYFSPFKYVDAGDIIENGNIDLVYLIIMLAIILLSIVSSYVLYQKKDIVI